MRSPPNIFVTFGRYNVQEGLNVTKMLGGRFAPVLHHGQGRQGIRGAEAYVFFCAWQFGIAKHIGAIRHARHRPNIFVTCRLWQAAIVHRLI